MSSSEFPKVSIGIPVFNGEKFIANRLECILQQSFKDFEIIISDNASTDLTKEICKKYEKKDSRIKLYQQTENFGMFHNYNFVLNHATGKYFVIANVDDFWDKQFLEKNIDVLESNSEVIVSVCKIKRHGPIVDEFKNNVDDKIFNRFYKWFRRQFRLFKIESVKGTFEEKVSFCLHNFNFWAEFGIFRRKELQQCMLKKPFYGWDWAIVINSLYYGEIHVIENELMSFHTGGTSSKGLIGFFRSQKIPLYNLILPFGFFTCLCIKKVGIKFFFKNFKYFIWLNFLGIIPVILEPMKIFKR